MKNRRYFNIFEKMARLLLTGKTKTINSTPRIKGRIDLKVFSNENKHKFQIK